MDVSKFKMVKAPTLAVTSTNWVVPGTFMTLLGPRLSPKDIPIFLHYWACRYADLSVNVFASVLKEILLESSRLMNRLRTIKMRWANGNDGGKTLFATKRNTADNTGQQLWAELKQLLWRCQDSAFCARGTETEWIYAGGPNEAEGKVFFYRFFKLREIRPLVGDYRLWNESCQSWIDAADTLSAFPPPHCHSRGKS